MTYSATNRKDIRNAEKAAAALDEARLAFLRAAMGTLQGRSWFYHLLADCHIFSTVPTFEPNKDYFALGERNVGYRIYAELTTNCPDQYVQMIREENDRIARLTGTRQQPGSSEPVGGVADESDAPDGADYNPYGNEDP